MTDFCSFARLNLPNVLISVAKNFFDSNFPFPCFDVPEASNFTSGGVQNRDTKNRRLGKIVTSIQDTGKENCCGKNFFATLTSTLGGFN